MIDHSTTSLMCYMYGYKHYYNCAWLSIVGGRVGNWFVQPRRWLHSGHLSECSLSVGSLLDEARSRGVTKASRAGFDASLSLMPAYSYILPHRKMKIKSVPSCLIGQSWLNEQRNPSRYRWMDNYTNCSRARVCVCLRVCVCVCVCELCGCVLSKSVYDPTTDRYRRRPGITVCCLSDCLGPFT